MRSDYDIVIVGAGPAGLSAAYFSKYYDADNNYKVLLIDRLPKEKYFTYHHMCGGCISHDAFKEIKPIKPNFVVENLKMSKEYVVDKFTLKNNIKGYIINRPKFFYNIIDEFKKMGGGFEHRHITEITSGKELIKLKTDKNEIIKTRYLIGADGASSKVRRIFGFEYINTIRAVQFIIDEEPEHGVLKFFYDQKYNGDYKWIFPNGETNKIGFPYIKDETTKIKGKILKKQSRLIGFGGMNNIVKDNVLLIGDAAGQTNSLSKGGIRPGMYAGRIAAKSIIKHNNPKQYEIEWKKSIFSSELMNEAFEKLKNMSNNEIIDHLKPFQKNNTVGFIKVLFLKKYWKYMNLYRAYNVEQNIGW